MSDFQYSIMSDQFLPVFINDKKTLYNGLFWAPEGTELDSTEFSNFHKFPMSLEVQQAIKQALQNIKTKSDEDPEPWQDSQLDTIKTVRDILSNGEVIPYIFPMKVWKNSTTTAKVQGENKTINCYTGSYWGNGIMPQISSQGYHGFNYSIRKDGGYDDMTQNIRVNSAHLSTSYLKGRGYNYLGYLIGARKAQFGGSYPDDAFNTNEWATTDYITSSVYMPRSKSIKSSTTYGNTRYISFNEERDLDGQKWYDLWEEYNHDKNWLDKNFPNHKIFGNLLTRNNSNDGNYSTENPRPTWCKYNDWGTAGTNSGGSYDTDKSQLVFIVKTQIPYTNNTYNYPQYWVFNVASLWSSPVSMSGEGFLNSNFIDGNDGKDLLGMDFCGFTTSSLFTDISQNTMVPQIFHIPFSFYIKHNTSFFPTGEVIGTVTQNTPTASIIFDTAFSVFGGHILSTEAEFLDFCSRGLNLPITNKEDEFLYKNTSEWAMLPPVYDPSPGSGGQIGGGTGGGSGIGGTDEGDKSDIVSTGTDTTGGARVSNAWILNETSANNLQNALVDDSIWTAISTMFKDDPREGLISMIHFPFNFENITEVNDEQVTILGDAVSTENNLVYGTKLPKTAKTRIEMGTFDFPQRFGSFLDYDPYTKISVYIPFVGFRNISANAVMRKRIKLQYDIDYTDGSMLAIISVSNNSTESADFSKIENGGFTPMYVFDGQIGQEIPLTSSDARSQKQQKIKSTIISAATIAAGAAAGGLAGAGAGATGAAATSAASSATGGMMAGFAGTMAANGISTLLQKPTYTTGGTVSSQHTFALGLYPYVIIEYAETNMPPQQGKITGFQTNIYKKLSNMSGFTVCDNIRIENISCTDAESADLKNILSRGIIINE